MALAPWLQLASQGTKYEILHSTSLFHSLPLGGAPFLPYFFSYPALYQFLHAASLQITRQAKR